MFQSTADDRYREALRRLAVILLSLALLAEDLTYRSWPLRCLVLWLLNQAENRVRGFASRAGAGPLPFGYHTCPAGGSNDVLRLAKKFRALAAVLFALSRQGPQWQRLGPRRGLFRNLRDVVLFCRASLAQHRCYADTS